jgi:hypothetical protein
MKNWIAFCGLNQTGSTIASAILDGHPNARVSFEKQAFKRWYIEKQSKEEILHQVMTSGHGNYRKKKALPGSGSWIARENQESLLAAGDKYGSGIYHTLAKGASADVIDEFSKFIGHPVKLVHTLRNPYDIIGGWVDRPKAKRKCPDRDKRFDNAVGVYVGFYNVMQPILDRYPHFDLYNDELIKNPRGTLTKLCGYLELPVVEPWLTTAVRSVYTEPHNRRDNREWFPGQKKQIEVELINKYPVYFERYGGAL